MLDIGIVGQVGRPRGNVLFAPLSLHGIPQPRFLFFVQELSKRVLPSRPPETLDLILRVLQRGT